MSVIILTLLVFFFSENKWRARQALHPLVGLLSLSRFIANGCSCSPFFLLSGRPISSYLLFSLFIIFHAGFLRHEHVHSFSTPNKMYLNIPRSAYNHALLEDFDNKRHTFSMILQIQREIERRRKIGKLL